jgi:hypothetical protein
MLDKLLGPRKTMDDVIKDLESQKEDDDKVLEKVKRISDLKLEHARAKAKIKQYSTGTNKNMMIFVVVLALVFIIFASSKC